MRVTSLLCAFAVTLISVPALAQEEVSIERGLWISIVGGCHACHTEGYTESEGKIDPAKALTGVPVGWRGPWGTTYADNLRIVANGMSEQSFVEYLQNMRTRPPMPWYKFRVMAKSDIQSLYQYILSLGEPGKGLRIGEVRPGEEPTTPYIQLVPPQMPKQ